MSNKKKKGGRMGLVVQAICAAEANITLAKQMLAEMHGGQLPGVSGKMAMAPVPQQRESFKERPGVIGTFDGEYMVTEDGKKYEVNKNYASKSMLTYGDTLKMVKEGDRNFFKQIERVKRRRVEGVLVKKDGKWCLVTSDGSYKLLDEAISFHKGGEGREAVGIIPQDNVKAPFAALEKVIGVEKEKKEAEKPTKGRPAIGRKAPAKQPAAKKVTAKPAVKTAARRVVAKPAVKKTAAKTAEKKETRTAATKAKSSKASEAPRKDELR